MWREGKWLDLWSVVHILSGITAGLGLYLLHLNSSSALVLALTTFILYEIWEAFVRIEETFTNRIMDILAGMTGFLPAFFLLPPQTTYAMLVCAFVVVFTLNVAMSIVGWRASQKAAALKVRMRARYGVQRKRILEQKTRLREKFRR